MRGEYPKVRHSCHKMRGSPPHAWGIPVIHRIHQAVIRFTPTCVGNTSSMPSGWGAKAVHPHMRGEYKVLDKIAVLDIGSPPHAWGIRDSQTSGYQWFRFTPTCVGNTCTASARSSSLPVHPHMRGEYLAICGISEYHAGSPPHAWGILIELPQEVEDERFTPTCVGNTC